MTGFRRIALLFTLIFVVTFTSTATLWAQQGAYWVYFRDKGPDIAQRLSQPHTYMSEVALSRRLADGIPLDAIDLPVYAEYQQAVSATGAQCDFASRWLNALFVYAEPAAIEQIKALPFVAKVEADKGLNLVVPAAMSATTNLDYGQANTQTKQIGLEYLHDLGYRGQGVRVAIFDSGFPNVNTLPAFADMMNGRVVATYDFVANDPNVYGNDSHGTNCLSILAAVIPSQYHGGADQADFLIARTENTALEGKVEERNWLAAAEWADQNGVQVITSSLVYNNGFTTGDTNYTYADMDGNTTIITRAADMAAGRGILVVNSAGNEGSNSWKKIAAPCDADSILCVGAVNAAGAIARFSSVGPSYDGRLKPNVVAMGASTSILLASGSVTQADGTSFASPLVACLATCLTQAHPNASNMQIIRAIELSADRASNPDTIYGYGIPNAKRADSILTQITSVQQAADSQAGSLKLGPNPTSGPINILLSLPEYQTYSLALRDALGRVVWTQPALMSNAQLPFNLTDLPSGIYTAEAILQNGQRYSCKLLLVP